MDTPGAIADEPAAELDLRHAAATNVIECNSLTLAPLPLVLPAAVLASLERPAGSGSDRLFRPLAKRVSSWLTKQQVVLMPPGLRHFVPNLTTLDRANVSFCHGNKERELSLAKRIRNLACALPDPSECQVARVYVELPLSPLPPPSEMQYGSKVVFSQAWMPFEFLRSTKGKGGDGYGAAGGSHRNSNFVTMQVDGVRYSRVAFSAVISPPPAASAAAASTGDSAGMGSPGSSGGGSTDGGGPSPEQQPASLLPQVALRWDPVERPPGAPPAYDTALRVFNVGATSLAEGPIELRWFPGTGDPAASADDRSQRLADRSRRAALRSISEAWFSYAHLAKVPTSGSAATAEGAPLPPPRVDDFDRRGVVITHTSDDETGGLASEVMDASKPLPDMRLVHLSRVYYSWPIPPPKALPVVKERGGVSPTLPFAFGWLPESLCGPLPEELGGCGAEALVAGDGICDGGAEDGFRLTIDGAPYVRCVYSVRTEHNATDDVVSAHISWAPFARTALATAAAAAAAGLSGSDIAPLWTADGFHLNADLSKALWKALSSAYVSGGSSSAAAVAAASGRSGGAGHYASQQQQLGWTAFDILDLLRDEGAFGDLMPPSVEALQRHMSPGFVPSNRPEALRYICFFGEQANLMLDGCTAEMSFVCLAFAAAEQSVLPGLRTRSLRWSRAAEDAEKLVSRWIDSAESATMAGVAARALALAGASLGSPCVLGVTDSLAAVAAIPGPCIEALPGGRSVLRAAVDIFARAVRAVHAGGAFASLLGAEAFVRLVAALILAPFGDFAAEAEFLFARLRDSGDGAGYVPDAAAFEAEPAVAAVRGPDFTAVLASLGKAAAACGRTPPVEKTIDELLAELGDAPSGKEEKGKGGKGGKKKAKGGGGAGKGGSAAAATPAAAAAVSGAPSAGAPPAGGAVTTGAAPAAASAVPAATAPAGDVSQPDRVVAAAGGSAPAQLSAPAAIRVEEQRPPPSSAAKESAKPPPPSSPTVSPRSGGSAAAATTAQPAAAAAGKAAKQQSPGGGVDDVSRKPPVSGKKDDRAAQKAAPPSSRVDAPPVKDAAVSPVAEPAAGGAVDGGRPVTTTASAKAQPKLAGTLAQTAKATALSAAPPPPAPAAAAAPTAAGGASKGSRGAATLATSAVSAAPAPAHQTARAAAAAAAAPAAQAASASRPTGVAARDSAAVTAATSTPVVAKLVSPPAASLAKPTQAAAAVATPPASSLAAGVPAASVVPEVLAKPLAKAVSRPQASDESLDIGSSVDGDSGAGGGDLLSMAWQRGDGDSDSSWASPAGLMHLGVGFSGGGNGLLGLPMQARQPPLAPQRQQQQSVTQARAVPVGRTLADSGSGSGAPAVAEGLLLLQELASGEAGASSAPGGSSLRSGGLAAAVPSSSLADVGVLSGLVHSLVAGSDATTAAAQPSASPAAGSDSVVQLLVHAGVAMAEMGRTVDALRAQLAAQEAATLQMRATSAQRIAQLELELSSRGIAVPSPLPSPLLAGQAGPIGGRGGSGAPPQGASAPTRGASDGPTATPDAAAGGVDFSADAMAANLAFLSEADRQRASSVGSGGLSGVGDSRGGYPQQQQQQQHAMQLLQQQHVTLHASLSSEAPHPASNPQLFSPHHRSQAVAGYAPAALPGQGSSVQQLQAQQQVAPPFASPFMLHPAAYSAGAAQQQQQQPHGMPFIQPQQQQQQQQQQMRPSPHGEPSLPPSASLHSQPGAPHMPGGGLGGPAPFLSFPRPPALQQQQQYAVSAPPGFSHLPPQAPPGLQGHMARW